MRCLEKPQFDVEKIVKDCAKSYTDMEKKNLFNNNASYIKKKSQEYDQHASLGEWDCITREDKVNGIITAREMSLLYSEKFAKRNSERKIYYDKIMSLAINGKCPICGISQVSTLDHYLAKSIYPTFAVTPVNLIPVCRDCNTNKGDYEITSLKDAVLHPYYDNVDEMEWLCAKVQKEGNAIVADYFINPNISGDLGLRLKQHFVTYKLKKAYAVQASSEIADNMLMWTSLYGSGKDVLVSYLQEGLKSREQNMKNTWHTALLRALINNIEVFSNC